MMKVCENCGVEIGGKDGVDNLCRKCDDADMAGRKRGRQQKLRREREQAMRDCGLVKVRGALGGTYWE